MCHRMRCGFTPEDGIRLRIVAKKHGAFAVLLATWKKGDAAKFFALRRTARSHVPRLDES